jgi:hypothetical protein
MGLDTCLGGSAHNGLDDPLSKYKTHCTLKTSFYLYQEMKRRGFSWDCTRRSLWIKQKFLYGHDGSPSVQRGWDGHISLQRSDFLLEIRCDWKNHRKVKGIFWNEHEVAVGLA